MARSFYTVIKQAARAADRAQRATVREQARQHREFERAHQRMLRESDRDARQAARDAKAQYLDERQDEADLMNEELEARIAEISSLLLASPEWAEPISFASLRRRFRPTPFDAAALGPKPIAPGTDQFRTVVPEPGLLARLLGGKEEHAALIAAALERDRVAYQEAKSAHQAALHAWEEQERATRAAHERDEAGRKAEVDDHNRSVDEFEAAYMSGSPDAVRDYATLVLERSVLPEGFPETFRLAYIPESKQLVVEHDLPALDGMPAVAEYSYVKAKDEIREKPQKKSGVADLYRRAVASVSIRVLNEIFSSDAANAIEVAVFNGVVHTIDAGTGEEIAPCLVSVRATKSEFSKLVLERVDPVQCLKALNASVSKKAEELAPVRPVIEFDMVDRRFVAEEDVIGSIETRPNIMELTPFEFEGLVANLFKAMGLETRQTRSSRDGGVDAVAFDPRPVLGGKVVIQAKRYRHTVGVSAVRDLFGTMMNEGANKGILVTTAGYGPDAFEFAKDKPIELLDGSALLYLLQQHGVEARIIMPS